MSHGRSLSNLDWETLYTIYDHKCYHFHPESPHIKGIKPTPNSDRALYYTLLTQAQEGRPRVTVEWYEALVYWKLYSQNRSGSKLAAGCFAPSMGPTGITTTRDPDPASA